MSVCASVSVSVSVSVPVSVLRMCLDSKVGDLCLYVHPCLCPCVCLDRTRICCNPFVSFSVQLAEAKTKYTLAQTKVSELKVCDVY